MYVCMYVRMYLCIYVFLGLGVLPPWNPTIMQGTSASPPPPPPPLWGGLGVVCMYLRRLVGIGMYVCNVMSCNVM